MSKKQVPVKTIYYSDELNEDFASTSGIKKRTIDENFKYFRENNFFIKLIADFLYFIIAKPIVFLILKILFHFKFVNKKVMRKRGKKGCFIYSNHTNYLPDASINSFLHLGRNYIIVGSQVVNIRGITNLVQDLGAIPLGDTLEAKVNFIKCIRKKLKSNASITIYPEAHIWPYYTKIRNFLPDSFRYPINTNLPVFTSTTCYTKVGKSTRPRIIQVIDGPFFADPTLEKKQAMKKLRDQVYNSMVKASEKYSNYEYYKYIRKD